MRRLDHLGFPSLSTRSCSFDCCPLSAATDVIGCTVSKVAAVTPHDGPRLRPSLLVWARHWIQLPSPNCRLATLISGALVLAFGPSCIQTYLVQWTDQKIMFDLRSQDLPASSTKRSPAFFDSQLLSWLALSTTSFTSDCRCAERDVPQASPSSKMSSYWPSSSSSCCA